MAAYVTSNNSQPYNWIAKVSLDANGDGTYEAWGTGFLLNLAPGGNDIVTAGHIVEELTGSNWRARVELGRVLSNGSYSVLDTAYVTGFNSRFPAISNNDSRITATEGRQDYALLAIDEDWSRYGAFSCAYGASLSDTGATVNVAGYPNFASGNMFTDDGEITSTEQRSFDYDAETGPGMSGGPVWVNSGGNCYAVGLHSASSGRYSNKSAVRFNEEIVADLRAWAQANNAAVAPVPPTVSLLGPNWVSEGNAGAASISYTVNLSSAAASDISIVYASRDGTATAGSDYGAVSGTLTIQAGSSSGQFSVPVYGDTLTEGNETFTVSLLSASGANLGSATTITTAIGNDDVADSGPYTAHQRDALYLYDALFNTRPSVNEFNTISGWRTSGRTVADIATSWGNSASGIGNLSRREALTTLFQNTLGRAPTDAERTWYQSSRDSTTLAGVVSELALSDSHKTAMAADINAWHAAGWGLA